MTISATVTLVPGAMGVLDGTTFAVVVITVGTVATAVVWVVLGVVVWVVVAAGAVVPP